MVLPHRLVGSSTYRKKYVVSETGLCISRDFGDNGGVGLRDSSTTMTLTLRVSEDHQDSITCGGKGLKHKMSVFTHDVFALLRFTESYPTEDQPPSKNPSDPDPVSFFFFKGGS